MMLKTSTNYGVNGCRAILRVVFVKPSNITAGVNIPWEGKHGRTTVQNYRNFHLQSASHSFSYSSRHLISDGGGINEPKDFAFFWESYRSRVNFKQRCINKIAKVFECSSTEAKLLIEKESVLFLDEVNQTVEKVRFLTGRKVTINFIRDNLWILHMKIPDLESRLNTVRLWGIDESYHHELLPMLKLPYLLFFRVSTQFVSEQHLAPYGNRLVYLAKSLDCSVLEITQRFLMHPALFFKNLNKMMISLETFQEFGVSGQDLVRDILALKSSEGMIRSRLSVAVAKGVKPLRPWMVRCPDDVFFRTIEIHNDEKNALGSFKSREEYLIHSLELDHGMVEVIRSKFPALYRVRMPKLRVMLDFLINVGYSPGELCVNPQIVSRNIDTLRDRLRELKSVGVESPSLDLLCKNEKDFEKIVARLIYFKSLKDDERVPLPPKTMIQP